MDELIQEMDSLFKQVVKYYPMNDIKETKKQWNDLVEAVAKQSKQQGNCNLPHVSNNEVAVCDHKIIKKGFHKGRCACGLFKEKQ